MQVSSRLAGLALSTFVLLSACILEHPPPSAAVQNRTGEPVEIYLVGYEEDGADRFVFELSDEIAVVIPDSIVTSCTMHTLEARTPQGEVVDRYTGQLCEGEVWEVDGEQ
jgi:hypothetical protein